MSAKVSDIRRQSASSVFESLQSALGIIDRQASCIRALQKALPAKGSEIDTHLISVTSNIGQLRDQIENIYADSEVDPALADPLNAAELSLQALKKSIEEARAKVRQLIGLHLESTKLSERGERFQQEGRRVLNGASQSDPLKALKTVWEEGLDLISGLCLRHEGLDNGLCRIADDLIAQVSSDGIKAISVPGRGGPGHLTSIVHLRFPEWTVWALPLTAHELWHLRRRSPLYAGEAADGSHILARILEIVGRTDREAQARLRESSFAFWNSHELQLCLADVFGVHMMGPSYACAAIWLVLDPLDQTHKLRAQCMLRALRAEPDYDEVHRVLEEQWREATKDSAPEELVYSEWVDALLKYLEEVVPKFNIERWRAVRVDWPEALWAGNISTVKAERKDIRCALAAGWKARLEKPDLHDTISKSCLDLCNKILEPTPAKHFPLGM